MAARGYEISLQVLKNIFKHDRYFSRGISLVFIQ